MLRSLRNAKYRHQIIVAKTAWMCSRGALKGHWRPLSRLSRSPRPQLGKNRPGTAASQLINAYLGQLSDRDMPKSQL
ncbi:MAG: hypothetical protein H6R00_3631 [Proteobacteria bacterium]|nr:hypothetical protein [Pseudomonadota bacterium]